MKKFRRLKASEIDARVSTISEKGCSLLLYKDARVDQNILDETVGAENWTRSHQLIGESLYCTVSIFDPDKKEWVSKQDVGTKSYTEEEKGLASDSFKRACFNWGIGRELYSAPFIWITAENVNLDQKNGKYTTYDNFKVKEIGYNEEGEINKLKIYNTKKKKMVYILGHEEPAETITKQEVAALKAMCDRKGVPNTGYRGKKIEALTGDEYVQAIKELEAMKDKE